MCSWYDLLWEYPGQQNAEGAEKKNQSRQYLGVGSPLTSQL